MGSYTRAIQVAHSRLRGDGFGYGIQGTMTKVLAACLFGVREPDDGVVRVWVNLIFTRHDLYYQILYNAQAFRSFYTPRSQQDFEE